MAEVTAALIKDLRERTAAGMADCKKAQTEVGSDMEKAIDYLRTKGLAKAAKKAGREATEGVGLQGVPMKEAPFPFRFVEVRGVKYLRLGDVAAFLRELGGSEETDVRNRLDEAGSPNHRQGDAVKREAPTWRPPKIGTPPIIGRGLDESNMSTRSCMSSPSSRTKTASAASSPPRGSRRSVAGTTRCPGGTRAHSARSGPTARRNLSAREAEDVGRQPRRST